MTGISLAATGATLALGPATGLLITRSVSIPLRHAVAAADAVAAGDLNSELPGRRGDEIGHLLEAMGRMRDGLRQKLLGISEMGERIQQSAGQLTQTATRSSSNVADQHSRTLQVASALEQMAAAVGGVARNTSDAARQAAETDRFARDGRRPRARLRSGRRRSALASSLSDLGR